MKKVRATLIVAGLVCGITVSYAPIASYAEGLEQYVAESTADLIAEVAPDAGEVVVPDVIAGEITAATTEVEVTIPVDPDEAITIQAVDVPVEGFPVFEVALPEEVEAKDARVTEDGTVVYSSNEKDGADVAVQVLEDGVVRVQTVTGSSEGTHEFTYSFGEATPVIQEDGSVQLVQIIDSEVALIEAIVGEVEPAWALDATGAPVETWYEVTDDGSLVQVVHPDEDTQYPVVADPTIGFTWQGVNIYFNREETRIIGSSQVGWVSLILGMGYPIVGVNLGVFNLVASQAYAQGKCLKYTWPVVVVTIGSYSGGNCK